MPKIRCLVCGGHREVGTSDLRRGLGKYCSRVCYHASQATRVSAECLTCGQPFVAFPSKQAKGNAKYCSRECCGISKRKDDSLKKNPAYNSWRGMRKRCLDEANHNYAHYGARGIKVCDRWIDSFEAFLEDMGPRPHGQSIDRIDVEGHYEPSNCRWASPLAQSRNRRNTIMVSYFGRDMPLAEYAELRGVRYASLSRRIKAGMDPETAADYLIGIGCLA